MAAKILPIAPKMRAPKILEFDFCFNARKSNCHYFISKKATTLAPLLEDSAHTLRRGSAEFYIRRSKQRRPNISFFEIFCKKSFNNSYCQFQTTNFEDFWFSVTLISWGSSRSNQNYYYSH